MINIVCFYWGNWCGSIGITYVNNLYNAIERNLSLPHQFYCFTDKSDTKYEKGIKIIPIQVKGWPWNFPKLLIYNIAFHSLKGRILMLDLDSVIVGSLDDLIHWEGQWITCEAAYQKHQIGGSVIGFTQSEYLEKLLWDPVNTKMKRDRLKGMTKGGSERYYYRKQFGKEKASIAFWQGQFPGQILSYKKDIRLKNEVPIGARIIRFHGKPRPHEVKSTWMDKYWI